MTVGKLLKLSLTWDVAGLSSLICLEVMKEQTWQIKIPCDGQDFQSKFFLTSLQIIEKINSVGKPLKLSQILAKIGLFSSFCPKFEFKFFWCIMMVQKHWINRVHPYTTSNPIKLESPAVF